jgi:hypothetical protein
MERGAQPGNTNREKHRAFRDALYVALQIKADKLEKNHRNDVLYEIAGKLVDAALLGEPWALKEFADRIEGKPESLKDDGPAQQGESKRLFING